MDTTAFRETERTIEKKARRVPMMINFYWIICAEPIYNNRLFVGTFSILLLFPIRHLFYSIDLYGANIVTRNETHDEQIMKNNNNNNQKFSEPNKRYCTYRLISSLGFWSHRPIGDQMPHKFTVPNNCSLQKHSEIKKKTKPTNIQWNSSDSHTHLNCVFVMRLVFRIT